MAEIAQVFGMIFVGIIVICVASTILNYIYNSQDMDSNKKLLDNIEKLDKKYKTKS